MIIIGQLFFVQHLAQMPTEPIYKLSFWIDPDPDPDTDTE